MTAQKSTGDSIRIGGASGFWGEANLATGQLLQDGSLNVIVYDYLAEITMAILARMRAKDPSAGYATDFVTGAMAPNLKEIARQGVKIIANAGGVNPKACADAVRALIEEQGLNLTVAYVEGDDLMPGLEDITATAPSEMFSGAAFPDAKSVGSVNAYLGAFPIADALNRGADIVITGRCVDSAVTLGACIHHFGWTADDLDQLAGGSLAGHIIECGPQTTGGNFTDWEQVAGSYHNIGYPIAEIYSDGSFDVTKPEGTGGLVSVGTVSEQMLYEIGDPRAYHLPDVICDFADVEITQKTDDLVHVSAATGRGVPAAYKTCLTHHAGWRGGQYFSFYGRAAKQRAQAFADAVFTRCANLMKTAGLADFTETSVEILGAESQYGTAADHDSAREIVSKIAVKHDSPKGVGLFLKEATGLFLSAPPGLSGFAGARPKPTPIFALFSYLTPKDQVAIRVTVGDVTRDFTPPVSTARTIPATPAALPAADMSGEFTDVPLEQLAFVRSGDKGDSANVGIIARDPAYLPYIWQAFSEERLRGLYDHFLEGDNSAVERFPLPGSHAMNVLMQRALGGGGTSSLRNDPQAKGFSQLVLEQPVTLPVSLASKS